jgi:hypothetical protein
MSGKLSGQEYQQFLDAVEERFKKVNEVNLVIDLTGFEFYGDLDAKKKTLSSVLENIKRFVGLHLILFSFVDASKQQN